MPDDVQRAKEAGFVGYWTKPINVAEIFSDLAPWMPADRSDTPALLNPLSTQAN
jgi:CheY-like chemotaxis protein